MCTMSISWQPDKDPQGPAPGSLPEIKLHPLCGLGHVASQIWFLLWYCLGIQDFSACPEGPVSLSLEGPVGLGTQIW